MSDNLLPEGSEAMQPKHMENSYPLSPMQQAMLIQDLSAPNKGVYIQQMVWKLNEGIDIYLLKEAIDRIVERHPVLRTMFDFNQLESPCQTVLDNVNAPFEYHDLRTLPETHQQSTIDAYLEKDRRKGFDMSIAPLMRFALFQMADASFQMVWTYHHALMDGRSHFIVLREIFECYDALGDGSEFMPDVPASYHEYINWLGRQDHSAAKQFWVKMLDGFYSATPIPVSRIPITRSVGTGRFGSLHIRLPVELTNALTAFSGEYDLTVNTLIQGAWAVLLARYSDEDDIVFGATRSCRHSGPENMASRVGVFINTVPVRVHLSPDKTVRSLLKEMRETWVDMREYENVPLSTIQQWSNIQSGTSLFNSILVFENYHFNEALKQLGGPWAGRSFDLIEQTEFPLTVFGYLDTEIILGISYSRGYFNDETVSRMLGHLKTLLVEMTAGPEKPVSQLQMLTAAEIKIITEDWNGAERHYPEWKCMHEIFEIQTARTPDNTAIVFGKTSITYRELSRRSNQIARYLKRTGIGPDIIAGICMDRSPDMIAALIGIHKVGGAYVPIDPDYPKERIAFMLADTGAPVLMTQEHLLPRLPDLNIHIICLDQMEDKICGENADSFENTATPDNLAYVIYTSGSTGFPKGVMIEHRALYNFAQEQARVFGLTADDRVVQLSSFTFDMSILDLLMFFCSGASLYMAEKEALLPGPPLAGYLRKHRITVITLPPSSLAHLPDEVFPDLRIVNVGGEPCPYELFRKWCKGRLFFNGYGPSEATIFVTVTECVNEERQPHIGRPIANTKIYILDPHMMPVPIGVTGEIYIGGISLARGYVNNPELTAERFIANPYSGKTGDRLYRTGDLARFLPDGNIEFIGRTDSQVKIRGIRVEPGEIEAALKSHKHVCHVAVIDRTDDTGNKQLAAYIVPESGRSLSPRDLHRFTMERLPSFLIPSAFVIMDSLPVLPSGKIDRRALPSPDAAEDIVETDYAAPRNTIERKLADLWVQVLGIKKAGIYHSFFEMGGDSLSAVRLFAKIEETFGKVLSPMLLFQANTIASLADMLQDQDKESSASVPVSGEFVTAIQPNGDKAPLFCIEPPDGQAIRYHALGRHMGGDYPVYAVHIHDKTRFSFDTIEEIASSYIREILVVCPEGPFFLCGFCVGGLIAFEMARQLHDQGKMVGFIALLDTYASRLPRYYEALGGSGRLTRAAWRLRKLGIWLFFASPVMKWNSIIYKVNKLKETIRMVFVIRNKNLNAVSPELPGADYLRKKLAAAANRYLPRPFPGKIILFKAGEQSHFVFFDEATYGWEKMAEGGVDVHMMDGAHLDIVHASQAGRIAETLKGKIDTFQSGQD